MQPKWEKASFKTNVLLKNIIGKELINDDNVAVMELVKNSYDAGASKVSIIFKNLFNGYEKSIVDFDDITNLTSRIIIQDNGVGMSKDDILGKWLNIAYSSKKIEHTQNKRYQAGNKGVGRFSCDRLGEFLNIYTRRKDEIILHLKISWKDFELIDKIDTQIQDIPVYIRELDNSIFEEESGFKLFEKGTILEIIKLNSTWAELDDDSLFPKIVKTKLLKLKSSIERLINPNQTYDNNSFKIFIEAKDLHEDKKASYISTVTGEIKNQIFSELDFKTTYIDAVITKDGAQIVTELKDKDKTIFKVIENNVDYPLLKDIRIRIYYLNPYAKAYFKRKTGKRSVNFGSIFLFINGFRISPYGDVDNDWLGLEQRKGQGVRRNLSGREILGRIEIQDFDNQYRVISSREGIVHNNSFKQLVSDFTKSKSSKYNGFYYKIHRRLEKYVVEGLSWDSSELDEKEIEQLVENPDWDEGKEKFLVDSKSKLYHSSEAIYSILGIKAKDVIDLYINEELIENLIEEDVEKTNDKLQTFLKNYSSLPADVFDEKTKKAIMKLSKTIQGNITIPEELSKKFKETIQEKRKIEKELKEQKKSQQELYKIFKKKSREERKKSKEKEKELEEKVEKLDRELEETKEEKDFFQRLNTSDKQQVLDLHHSIGTASVTINNHLGRIQKKIQDNQTIDNKFLEKVIKQISFVNNKISSIANFATKASWDADSEDIEDNIVKYIKDYISNVCMIELKTMDHKPLVINLNNLVKIEFTLRFQPIQIAMLFDNLISNSRKAYATKIDIDILIKDDDLVITYHDNGKGVSSDIQDKIFNLGFSTTSGGAGMGMAHIKRILMELNHSSIELDKSLKSGAKFLIRIKK